MEIRNRIPSFRSLIGPNGRIEDAKEGGASSFPTIPQIQENSVQGLFYPHPASRKVYFIPKDTNTNQLVPLLFHDSQGKQLLALHSTACLHSQTVADTYQSTNSMSANH